MRKTLCMLAVGTLLVLMTNTAAYAQHPTDRPSDNLLARADLQAIVDLQVERDAKALVERLGATDPAVRARAALGSGTGAADKSACV